LTNVTKKNLYLTILGHKMENELEKALESKFFCPTRFAQEIETLVHADDKMSYIDAIVHFCDKNSIDLAQEKFPCKIASLNSFLREKIPGKKFEPLLFS